MLAEYRFTQLNHAQAYGDYAELEPSRETFAMRFKDKQHAADFKVAFEKALEENLALKAKQDQKDKDDVEAAAKQLENLSVDNKPADDAAAAVVEEKVAEAKTAEAKPEAASE